MPTATNAVIQHPADRLLEAFERCGAPVCVGLDPVVDRLPTAVFGGDVSKADAIRRFCLGVLDAIEPFIACVKLQSACFERFGWPGVSVLHDVLAAARAKHMAVILDAKRGDIGMTAEHYAAASAYAGADWTTVNGYLGEDGIKPFLVPDDADSGPRGPGRGMPGFGRGAFVLVRTSNPSGDAFQSLSLQDGRTIAEAMADLVAALGARRLGSSGFSNLGAVVGATKRTEIAALRARMPQQLLLLPGYGAQGAGVDDVLPAFRADGRGAIVTASRAVLYPASATATPPERPTLADWTSPVARAAERFRDEIRRGLGRA
ncbi:MAG: orotidine-5'-phosphate decarboxylase [Phycisphaerales bacterium]